MQSSTVVTGASLSFTTHSSNNLAEVAARVVQELRRENSHAYDDIFNFNDNHFDKTPLTVPADKKLKDHEKDCNDDDDDDDEFQFAVVCSDVDSSHISVDQVFSQGHILPRYPLFDRSLLSNVDPDLIKVVNGTPENNCKPSSLVVRVPLRKLFNEERDFTESWSSSEADDLDGVTPGSYCVWKPKTESPVKCKKSNSTGNSSRRWKFRDILYRSNSDGKESPFLLFKPLIATNKKTNDEKAKNVEKSAKVASAVDDGASVAAEEEKNPANKAENRVNRRR